MPVISNKAPMTAAAMPAHRFQSLFVVGVGVTEGFGDGRCGYTVTGVGVETGVETDVETD